MKKLILASISAVALFGVAACSDSTDATTTQSTTPDPAATETVPPADTMTTTPPPVEPAPAN